MTHASRIVDALYPPPAAEGDGEDVEAAEAAAQAQRRTDAAALLGEITFKLLTAQQQQVSVRPHPFVEPRDSIETAELVSATLGAGDSQQRVLLAFTSRRAVTSPLATTAVHLLNITDQGRYQPVLSTGLFRGQYTLLSRLTYAGTAALHKMITRSGLKVGSVRSDMLKLLVVGAKARADEDAPVPMAVEAVAGPSSSASTSVAVAATGAVAAGARENLTAFAKQLATVLQTARPAPSVFETRPAEAARTKPIGIASNVGLLLWTPKTASASKQTAGVRTTEATKLVIRAIEELAPKSKATPRKEGFKMAAALETPIEFDPTAGWSGDCGLVDIISPDSFVHVLSFTDHHTRAVWTELVCKSFRALRGEPTLWASLRLSDSTRRRYVSEDKRKLGPWKCKAEHWANIVASKASCLTALDLSGNDKAPLTALKACLRAAPQNLRSLDLDGVASANIKTLAEIERFTELETLCLNCSHPKDGFGDEGESVIRLVKGLPRLQLLRVQPFTAFGSFLGDWDFVAGIKEFRDEHLARCAQFGVNPYREPSGSGFEDEDEDEYVSNKVLAGQARLKRLQEALPRCCRLTNSGYLSGYFLTYRWGEPPTDEPVWHVWYSEVYKRMTEPGAKRGTSYLQCGPLEEGEARRHKTYGEWLSANKPTEALKPAGPVIST